MVLRWRPGGERGSNAEKRVSAAKRPRTDRSIQAVVLALPLAVAALEQTPKTVGDLHGADGRREHDIRAGARRRAAGAARGVSHENKWRRLRRRIVPDSRAEVQQLHVGNRARQNNDVGGLLAQTRQHPGTVRGIDDAIAYALECALQGRRRARTG